MNTLKTILLTLIITGAFTLSFQSMSIASNTRSAFDSNTDASEQESIDLELASSQDDGTTDNGASIKGVK